MHAKLTAFSQVKRNQVQYNMYLQENNIRSVGNVCLLALGAKQTTGETRLLKELHTDAVRVIAIV